MLYYVYKMLDKGDTLAAMEDVYIQNVYKQITKQWNIIIVYENYEECVDH